MERRQEILTALFTGLAAGRSKEVVAIQNLFAEMNIREEELEKWNEENPFGLGENDREQIAIYFHDQKV